MQRKSLFYCLLACLSCFLMVWIPSSLGQSSSLRPESVAATIYQTLPYLPKSNEYKTAETGRVNPESTLMSRFIRYHQDVKKRTNIFRLDWKLTMSDYLGINEPVKADRYPGSASLQVNPMEEDLKIIRSLNRAQRQQLVDLLVSIYAPVPAQVQKNATPPPVVTEPSEKNPSKRPLSNPGDARLLLP